MSELNTITDTAHSHRAVTPWATLLSLLESYAATYFTLGVAISRSLADAERVGIMHAQAKSNKVLLGVLGELREACAVLDLQFTMSAIDRFSANMQPYMKGHELLAELTEIERRARDELGARHFLYVSPDKYDLHKSDFPLGRDVHERFPDISTDAIEASRCLAFGRHTASAFHLARVLEHGLLFFADKVKAVPTSQKPTWGHYTAAIKIELDALPEIKKSQKEKKAKLRRVYEAFDSIRVVWRNPIAHDLGMFVTPDDAENLLARTKQVYHALVEAFPKSKR